jgi:replicative DNA helicase Mcm
MMIKLHQDQKTKLMQLKDLPNRSYIKQKGFIWNGKEKETFTFHDIYIGVNQTEKRKYLPEVSVKMDEWLKFLGIWFSDGWIVNTNKSGRYLGVTQSFNNKSKRNKIKKNLSELPFKFYEANDDFRLNNLQVYNYLFEFGKKGEKNIPPFIFDLSPRQIRLFLDFYHLGDGWFHKGTKYYVFGEKRLADQVQELILKAGGSAIINEIDPKNIKRNKIPEINGQQIIATKKYWTITDLRISYVSIVKKEIEEVDYNDHAYCLTVPNHTLYVRRNGKPMFCGNSGSTYSTSGGTGSHLDLRIRNAYGKLVDPLSFLKNYKS